MIAVARPCAPMRASALRNDGAMPLPTAGPRTRRGNMPSPCAQASESSSAPRASVWTDCRAAPRLRSLFLSRPRMLACLQPRRQGTHRNDRTKGGDPMSSQLTPEELATLMPSELVAHQTPIPTQIVSSDEFYPDPQNERQREVEARLLAMADDLGGKQGLGRRRFFQTAAGMAASFVAMNEVYGPLFDATKAEAATPALAQERAGALKDQFIMDMHTHFLRDDTRIMGFVEMRKAVGKAGWNKQLG